MKVRLYEQNGIQIVEARGKFLGGSETDELDERLYALLGRKEKKVVLDLGQAVWINSSGIAILIHHWKKFRDLGGSLKLANLTQKIERLLVISKLTKIFETYDSLEEAVASFKD